MNLHADFRGLAPDGGEALRIAAYELGRLTAGFVSHQLEAAVEEHRVQHLGKLILQHTPRT